MRTIQVLTDEDLEPRCTGSWLPVEGGPWHARCPVCEHVETAEGSEDAMQKATDHCSRKRMREQLDAIMAWIDKRDATFMKR